MTAALLAVKIKIADFDGFAAGILPFNLDIGFVHTYFFFQRPG